MALFTFICQDCKHRQEHFVLPNSKKDLVCPECSSKSYTKGPSRFGLQVEYRDNDDYMENKIQPMIDETYAKIGKEAANEDTKTLDNLFGEEKVSKSLYGHDD